MRVLLLATVIGCSDPSPACVPDANNRCVTWHWTFFDADTMQPTSCPANVADMGISGNTYVPGFDGNPGHYMGYGVTSVDCPDMTGTMLLDRRAERTILSLNTTDVRFGDRGFASEVQNLGADDTYELDASIATNRGFITLTYSVYSTSLQRNLTCMDPKLYRALYEVVLLDAGGDKGQSSPVRCSDGELVTTNAVMAGTYGATLRVALFAASTYQADLGTVVVTAGADTDLPPTTVVVE